MPEKLSDVIELTEDPLGDEQCYDMARDIGAIAKSLKVIRSVLLEVQEDVDDPRLADILKQ